MKQLTEITFGQKREVSSCEDIFVFSGTHSGHWEKAIEAYQNGFASKLIVTGDVSRTGIKHEKWTDENL